MEKTSGSNSSLASTRQSQSHNMVMSQSLVNDEWCKSTHEKIKDDRSILKKLNFDDTQKLLVYLREYEALCAIDARYQ